MLEIVQQSRRPPVGEGEKLHHDHSANVAMRIDPIVGVVYPGPRQTAIRLARPGPHDVRAEFPIPTITVSAGWRPDASALSTRHHQRRV